MNTEVLRTDVQTDGYMACLYDQEMLTDTTYPPLCAENAQYDDDEEPVCG